MINERLKRLYTKQNQSMLLNVNATHSPKKKVVAVSILSEQKLVLYSGVSVVCVDVWSIDVSSLLGGQGGVHIYLYPVYMLHYHQNR